MIIYSNPYDTTKSIGKAYNDFIKCIYPENDPWICIQDGDILYLTSRWGMQIEEVTKTTAQGYDLIGCMTNRVGMIHQLHQGRFEENHDIMYHRQIAFEREKTQWAKVIPSNNIIAGYFMLFKYSTWLRVGGFKEGVLDADRQFSNDILRYGGYLGLMPGLYVYHMYRPHRQGRHVAQSDYKHLIK